MGITLKIRPLDSKFKTSVYRVTSRRNGKLRNGEKVCLGKPVENEGQYNYAVYKVNDANTVVDNLGSINADRGDLSGVENQSQQLNALDESVWNTLQKEPGTPESGSEIAENGSESDSDDSGNLSPSSPSERAAPSVRASDAPSGRVSAAPSGRVSDAPSGLASEPDSSLDPKRVSADQEPDSKSVDQEPASVAEVKKSDSFGFTPVPFPKKGTPKRRSALKKTIKQKIIPVNVNDGVI